MTTVTTLDPHVSEFDTPEQEADYNAWIRAELAPRLITSQRLIPHDEVMKKADSLISELEGKAK